MRRFVHFIVLSKCAVYESGQEMISSPKLMKWKVCCVCVGGGMRREGRKCIEGAEKKGWEEGTNV